MIAIDITVIPAKAGIQTRDVCVFAISVVLMDSGLRRNDDTEDTH